MIQSNPVHQVCNYGSSAVYCASPSPEQIRSGVIPLDSLPASWWNWMWADTNQAVNEAREAVGVFVNELNSVLAAAGICPNCMCLNQLYQAIDKIRTTIGNAACAGAVKSSSCPGEVSIGAEGIMTANCVGNASQLATSARTLVGAVNELKQTYDCCISTINGSITSLGNTKAPNCHASCDTTYGVGSSAEYGHLKITDTFDTCVGGASEGLAVSQAALYNAFTCITGSSATLGNVVACPEAVSPSAGICNLAARSDHTHPYPKHLCLCAGYKVCDALYNWGWYGIPMDTNLGLLPTHICCISELPPSCCYGTDTCIESLNWGRCLYGCSINYTVSALIMHAGNILCGCKIQDHSYKMDCNGAAYLLSPAYYFCRCVCSWDYNKWSCQYLNIINDTSYPIALKGVVRLDTNCAVCPGTVFCSIWNNGCQGVLWPGCTASFCAGKTACCFTGNAIYTCITTQFLFSVINYPNPKGYANLDYSCVDDRNKIICQQQYTSVIFNSEGV